MLQTAYKTTNPTIELISTLASRTEGNLSPRSCCHLYDSVVATANLAGRANLSYDDLRKVVPFFKELGDTKEVTNFINKFVSNDQSRRELYNLWSQFKNVQNKMDNLNSQNAMGNAIAGLRFVKEAKNLFERVKELRVPDDVYEDKQNMLDEIDNTINSKSDKFTSML